MPSFSLESLFIIFAFVLPGFLTSRLLVSKIPAPEKQPKPFVEITESLLRSTYINLIVGTSLLLLMRYVVLSQNHILSITNDGIQKYLISKPFASAMVLIIWLTLDLLLATWFGYKWDPLSSLYTKSRGRVGVNNEDLWHNLRQTFSEELDTRPNDLKIWAQVRLKNGNIYQGGIKFVTFREDSKSREFLLTDVSLITSNTDDKNIANESQNYHAVILDSSNCDSIEILVEGLDIT